MILGITMGDAAGIGPEIIVGAWREIIYQTNCRVVVYGHPGILQQATVLRKINAVITEIPSVDELLQKSEVADVLTIPCIRCGGESVVEVPHGTVDARAGDAAYRAIIRAIDDAKTGILDAVITAPIHKNALNLAGYHYPGHTEIFAERCGVNDFAMMLYLGHGENICAEYGLAVVHVTLHTAMKNIFGQITIDSVLAKARLIDDFMKRMIGLSGRRPRIGVCSLNPHAGEDGLFGTEEIQIIRPAIQRAVAEGLEITGPFPADTIMVNAQKGNFDAVVAMFHDQGHIALKLLGMHRAVNITLGLPIIRTSVAHGTAFDKAWRGIAGTGSLLEACRVAAKLAASRQYVDREQGIEN
ncbi:MAG: 4-hydroxythreonine-4-phosphate dehydrogenase PdxA [Planctomycetaceae bacterium]|jgi:4-hydroxythreonine-4-phosphate dehydrogenase|nr:4-hydroxythreonine-4-phosphate dehydrogenase PdxA [Planctomycetaceae bacterium]